MATDNLIVIQFVIPILNNHYHYYTCDGDSCKENQLLPMDLIGIR